MVLLVIGLVLYPMVADSRIGGSPGSRTGAPISNNGLNEATCGSTSNCHVNSEGGPGQVVIVAPEQYTPGGSLEFTVRVEEEARSTFGFQAAIKVFNTQNALHEHTGSLERVDSTRTRIVASDYITHTQEGINQNEWVVRWNAPAEDVGPVTIYVAGNAADGDGGREGDHTYMASWRMTANTPTAIEEEPTPTAFTLERAYPNPFSTVTTIRYTLRRAAPVMLSVYDALGRRLRVLDQGTQNAGTHTIHLGAESLAAGLYLYELRTPDARETRPMMVMK